VIFRRLSGKKTIIFWWVCAECDGVDGVVVISSDDDDDVVNQDNDPFLFPGDVDQHRQNIIIDDDDDEVQVPEDLDFAVGRVIQQRFVYGLTTDLRNQQIYKEILQGTYIFHILVVCLSVCLGCHVVAHTECAHIHLEKV